MNDYYEEELKDLYSMKKQLKTATREHFQLLLTDNHDYQYTVSFYGCYDIAKFIRKADAQKFINTFPLKTVKKD